MPEDVLTNIYNYMSRENIKNFPANIDDFRARIAEDQSLSNNVYNYLSSKNIKNFPKDYYSFMESTGIKSRQEMIPFVDKKKVDTAVGIAEALPDVSESETVEDISPSVSATERIGKQKTDEVLQAIDLLQFQQFSQGNPYFDPLNLTAEQQKELSEQSLRDFEKETGVKITPEKLDEKRKELEPLKLDEQQLEEMLPVIDQMLSDINELRAEASKKLDYETSNNLFSAMRNLERSKKLINTMADGKQDPIQAIKSFLDGLSAKEIAYILSAGWTSAFSELKIIDILKKQEKGKELTDDEQLMLESKYLYQVIQSNKETPMAYNIGMGVAEMIPYMMQIVLFRGASAAIEKSIAKAGENMLKNKAVTALKKYGIDKIVGKVASSMVQSPTTSMMWQAYADAKTGALEISDEGKIVRMEGSPKSTGKALYNSFISTSASLFSEKFGELLLDFKGIGKAVPNAMKQTTKSKAAIQQFLKDAKWNGLAVEYLEEQIDMVLQAILTEEAKLSDLLDIRQQFEIFATIAIASGAFKAIEIPGYLREQRYKGEFENAKKHFEAEIDEETRKVIDAAIDSNNIDQATEILKRGEFDHLSPEQGVTALNYIRKKFQYNALFEASQTKADVAEDVTAEEKPPIKDTTKETKETAEEKVADTKAETEVETEVERVDVLGNKLTKDMPPDEFIKDKSKLTSEQQDKLSDEMYEYSVSQLTQSESDALYEYQGKKFNTVVFDSKGNIRNVYLPSRGKSHGTYMKSEDVKGYEKGEFAVGYMNRDGTVSIIPQNNLNKTIWGDNTRSKSDKVIKAEQRANEQFKAKETKDATEIREDEGQVHPARDVAAEGEGESGKDIQQPKGERAETDIERDERLKRVENVKSKPLTRIEGLQMGQNQAEGVYVSTEESNRYAKEGAKAETVEVEVENPIEFDAQKGDFADARKELLNNNRGKFTEADFEEYRIPDKETISVDDLNQSGIEKLAGIVTKHFKSQGYDSIHFTGEGEGELIVFDKSKVKKGKEVIPKTPQEERDLGYKYDNYQRYERKDPIENKVEGKETERTFSDKVTVKGKVTVIEADELIPSHAGRNKNPLHFIEEAQPKNRTDYVSEDASDKIADRLNVKWAGEDSSFPYQGAPVVNTRGEVIQGNNRASGLKKYWERNRKDTRGYKAQLIKNAKALGLDPEKIKKMKNPTLVFMADVTDAKAIELGQYTAEDLETGGVKSIKPKETIRKLGNRIESFVNILTAGIDESTPLRETLRSNAIPALKFLINGKFISDSQYNSALKEGRPTNDFVDSLEKMLLNNIFEGGRSDMDEIFDRLPYAVRNGLTLISHILPSIGLREDVQEAIMAYGEFQGTSFAAESVEGFRQWVKAENMFTGLPSENYSNQALRIAELFAEVQKSKRQKDLTTPFKQIMAETQEGGLFDQSISKKEAFEKIFKTEYDESRTDEARQGESEKTADEKGDRDVSKESPGEKARRSDTEGEDKKRAEEDKVKPGMQAEEFAAERKGKKQKAKTEGVDEVRKKAEKQERKDEGGKASDWVDESKLSNEALHEVQLPELIELIHKLSGKFPVIKDFRNLLRRGRFLHEEGGTSFIELSRNLFKKGNEAELAKVIRHEFGHFLDFIEQHTLRRGNILGRIASVREYVDNLLKEFSESKSEILTKEDRARFKKEAEEALKEEFDKGVREVIEEVFEKEPIFKTKGITPEDVMEIWKGMNARETNPALYDYISRLSAREKSNIMKQALKGVVDRGILKEVAERELIGERVRKKIVKKTVYPKPATKENIRKKYMELLEQEINKRRLFQAEVILEELKELTMWWRPFDEGKDADYTAYRFRSRELYADAISVLLANPRALAEKAPNFNLAFFNYIGEKPTFKKLYDELQELYKQPKENLMQHRLNRIYEGYKKASELREKLSKKFDDGLSVWDRFLATFFSKNIPVFNKIKKDKKLLKELGTRNALRNEIEKMAYTNESVTVFLNRLQVGIIDVLKEAGIDLNAFGALLELERNLYRERGGEKVFIAEPGAFNETIDHEMSEFIRNKYDSKQQLAIDKALKEFHDLIYEHVEDLYKAGGISEKTFNEIIKPNKDNYATFSFVEHIDRNYIPATIKEARGGLGQVENPIMSTALKVVSMIQMTKKQNALNSLYENYKVLEDSKIDLSENKKAPVGKTTIDYYVDGKRKYLHVDLYVAEVFKRNFELANSALNFFRKYNKYFKPAVTTWNMGWAFYSNLARDTPRTILNVFKIIASTEGLGYAQAAKAVGEYLWNVRKNLKAGKRFAKGEIDALIEEMLKEGAIAQGVFGAYDAYANEMLNPLFYKAGVYSKEKTLRDSLRERSKIIEGGLSVLEFIEFQGTILEAFSKISAYTIYRKYTGSKATAGFYTRNYAGTPNFRDKAYVTKTTNEVFTFSNVILQALRTDLELALGKETRGAFILTTSIAMGFPALMVGLAASGVFGDELEEAYMQIPEYDKLNFLCIVLPFKTKENRPFYLRVPMDEFNRVAYAATYKLTTNILNEDGFSLKDLQALLSVGADMIPTPSPLITIANGWGQFFQGDNPRDNFYGKDVLTQRQYDEGGWPAISEMLTWTLEKSGGGFIVRAFDYDPIKDRTTEHVLKNIPILNRAIRIGQGGEGDIYGLEKAKISKEAAKQSRLEQDVINKQVLNMQKAGKESLSHAQPYYDAIAEELFGTTSLNSEQRSKMAAIKRKFNIAFNFGLRSPYTSVANAMIYATNAEKESVIKKYSEIYGIESAIEMMKFAEENKLISADLHKKLRREFEDMLNPRPPLKIR